MNELDLKHSIIKSKNGLVYDLKVDIVDKKDRSRIVNFVSYESIKRALDIEKKGELKGLALSVKAMIINSPYYFYTTKILVSEYLRENRVINVDSFALFNMEDFREDLRRDPELKIKKRLSKLEDLTDDLFLKDLKKELINTLEQIKKGFIKERRQIEYVETLDIIIKNSKLCLKLPNGKTLNSNNLFEMLGYKEDEEKLCIPKEKINSTSPNIMFLIIPIVFLKTQKIIIHGNEEEALTLKSNINKEFVDYGLFDKYEIKLEICTNCNKCI